MLFKIQSICDEVREYTPGKLGTPQVRGPNETRPSSTKRPL